MRYLISLICLSFFFAMAQESYYPSREGLSWTYSNGETQTLIGMRDVGGQMVMVLTHYIGGNPVSEDYMLYDDQGVRTIGTSASGQVLSYAPALILYPEPPLEVGQTWKSRAQVEGFEIALSYEVVAVRGVQTAAGRFNALQIRQQTVTTTGGQTSLDLFFVPSVGVVRFVTQDGTSVDLIEKNF